ncbi:MAG: hypothetical protein J1F10_01110 [Muribaculaceae bacterium]|nr:hypothetical protein [Muribaculaceae bacterium]
MKHFLILLSFLIISEIIKAQETTTDSIKTQELGEIIVEASQIIRKADMDVYFPSNGACGNSKNGIQLLANLMIPSLSVNEALGTIHKITNNSWCGNASLRLTHWGFVFGAQYMHAQRNIMGEKLSWDEDLNIIDLNYNWKGWQFGTGCIMPFGKYDRGSMSMSRWNKNEKHIRLNMRIPYISIRYNLQWGRQKRDIQKLISTDSTIEKSTASGR